MTHINSRNNVAGDIQRDKVKYNKWVPPKMSLLRLCQTKNNGQSFFEDQGGRMVS